jgi:hypothetical protein
MPEVTFGHLQELGKDGKVDQVLLAPEHLSAKELLCIRAQSLRHATSNERPQRPVVGRGVT